MCSVAATLFYLILFWTGLGSITLWAQWPAWPASPTEESWGPAGIHTRAEYRPHLNSNFAFVLTWCLTFSACQGAAADGYLPCVNLWVCAIVFLMLGSSFGVFRWQHKSVEGGEVVICLKSTFAFFLACISRSLSLLLSLSHTQTHRHTHT